MSQSDELDKPPDKNESTEDDYMTAVSSMSSSLNPKSEKLFRTESFATSDSKEAETTIRWPEELTDTTTNKEKRQDGEPSDSSDEVYIEPSQNFVFKQPLYFTRSSRYDSFSYSESDSDESNDARLANLSIILNKNAPPIVIREYWHQHRHHPHHEHCHDHSCNYHTERPSSRPPSSSSLKSIKEYVRHKFKPDETKRLHPKKSREKIHKFSFHSQFFHSHPTAHIQRTKLSRISKRIIVDDELPKIRDVDIVSRMPSESRIVRPKIWIQPRLRWLEELEAETDKRVIEAIIKKDKEYRKMDTCCFPFSTFQIFNRKQAKAFRYHMDDYNLDSD